jgi:hypothetical protein
VTSSNKVATRTVRRTRSGARRGCSLVATYELVISRYRSADEERLSTRLSEKGVDEAELAALPPRDRDKDARGSGTCRRFTRIISRQVCHVMHLSAYVSMHV